ncbi:MAG: HPr family phosphocarrier protein [bacterium]|nr:HPr family phosphocarrier protein [bacterium]
MGLERTVRLVNASGLHARPCHSIVASSLPYGCTLRVGCGEREVNGKSILELMTLEAPCGADLVFRAEGEGAETLLDLLEALVAGGFDESL